MSVSKGGFSKNCNFSSTWKWAFTILEPSGTKIIFLKSLHFKYIIQLNRLSLRNYQFHVIFRSNSSHLILKFWNLKQQIFASKIWIKFDSSNNFVVSGGFRSAEVLIRTMNFLLKNTNIQYITLSICSAFGASEKVDLSTEKSSHAWIKVIFLYYKVNNQVTYQKRRLFGCIWQLKHSKLLRFLEEKIFASPFKILKKPKKYRASTTELVIDRYLIKFLLERFSHK